MSVSALLRRQYKVSSLLNVMLLWSTDGQSFLAVLIGVVVFIGSGRGEWSAMSQPVRVLVIGTKAA
jgi:hypothetical protein